MEVGFSAKFLLSYDEVISPYIFNKHFTRRGKEMSYPWTGFCRQYIEYQLSLFTSGAYLFPNSAGCGGECYHQGFRDRGSHPAALHIMPKAIGTYNICALYRVLFLTD